jgi:hypothetical protein
LISYHRGGDIRSIWREAPPRKRLGIDGMVALRSHPRKQAMPPLLVVKAGLVNLTGDDRATILGALLWIADKLQSDQGEQARALWVAKGKQAFEADQTTRKGTDRTVPAVRG